MKLSEVQQQFTRDVSLLIAKIFESGYSCTLGECYRTPEQAKLNAKKGIGIAKSLHCERLAVDLNLFSPQGEYLASGAEYVKFGTYWESLNPKNRAGMRFGDANHFERSL